MRVIAIFACVSLFIIGLLVGWELGNLIRWVAALTGG